MEYEKAIKKINSFSKFGIQPGLERERKLLELMGNPQDNIKFIHVAGTNGKGSVCTMLASVLSKAGYKTGLFISPHVNDFRERMQINCEMIPKSELAGLLDYIVPFVEKLVDKGYTITEFELITAIALKWFAENKCDYVVFEVGLGGRFDATNVINTPLVSVITSIALDHTFVLGNTLKEIAKEKCGIIKQNGTTVVYPEQDKDVFEVIDEIAKKKDNNVIIADLEDIEIVGESLTGTIVKYEGFEIAVPFIGKHQIKNTATALAVIDELKNKGVKIRDHAIKNGIESSKIPARLEILLEKPLVLQDGAHNPLGAKALSEAIRQYFLSGEYGKIIAVIGMMEDKDAEGYLEHIAPLFSEIITVSTESNRALSAEKLADKARKYCSRVTAMDKVNDVLRKVLKDAEDNDVIIVCGSLYMKLNDVGI